MYVCLFGHLMYFSVIPWPAWAKVNIHGKFVPFRNGIEPCMYVWMAHFGRISSPCMAKHTYIHTYMETFIYFFDVFLTFLSKIVVPAVEMEISGFPKKRRFSHFDGQGHVF